MIRSIIKIIRILHRRLYDYPFNWKPYGWGKDELKQKYWRGEL